jgi:hypothetical protein
LGGAADHANKPAPGRHPEKAPDINLLFTLAGVPAATVGAAQHFVVISSWGLTFGQNGQGTLA